MKTLQRFGSVRCWPSRCRRYRGLPALALACLSAFSATQSGAEVVVDGDRDQMRVSIDDDTAGHVLEALRQKGILQYEAAAPLNKVVGGTFSGSLGHVLSRILVGFDYVVRSNPQGVEIFVYGESDATGSAAPPRPQTASQVAQRAPAGIVLVPKNVTLGAPSQHDAPTGREPP
jgi:hypothetical protein